MTIYFLTQKFMKRTDLVTMALRNNVIQMLCILVNCTEVWVVLPTCAKVGAQYRRGLMTIYLLASAKLNIPVFQIITDFSNPFILPYISYIEILHYIM